MRIRVDPGRLSEQLLEFFSKLFPIDHVLSVVSDQVFEFCCGCFVDINRCLDEIHRIGKKKYKKRNDEILMSLF